MGALTTTWACGLDPAHISWASPHEAVWRCGNALVLHDTLTQHQRLLVGPGHGIRCFAANSAAGVLAIAEEGPSPRVWVHRASDLQLLATLPERAELEFTALAFSGDGELLAVASGAPGASLAVWQWRKEQLLASAPLEAPVGGAGFHPADAGLLVTYQLPGSRSGGEGARAAQLWRLERQWAGHSLAPGSRFQPSCGGRVACHAWAPEGLYVGCDSGVVVLIDHESGRELASTREAAAAAAGGDADNDAGGAAARSSSEATAGPRVGGGIVSIAVNADAVVVCGGRLAGGAGSSGPPPLLRWYRRGGEGRGPAMALAGEVPGTAGAACVALCGQAPRNVLVAMRDGCALLMSPLPPAAAPVGGAAQPAAVPSVEPLADCHAGSVMGLARLPGAAGRVLSAGEDGSLRLWDAAGGGQLVGRRDCPGAALTSLAAAARAPLAAVGSAAGVLRLVSTADGRLPLVWRGRIARHAVAAVAFSQSGGVLAAACRGGGAARDCIAFLSVARAGQRAGEAVQLLGYTDCGDGVLSMAWAQQSSDGGGSSDDQGPLTVSLAGGAVMLLRPPTGPAPLAVAENGSGGGGGEAAAELLMRLPLEALQARVAAVPAPLACIAAGWAAEGGAGSKALWVAGHSAAGRQLQRFVLPPDLPAPPPLEKGGALPRPSQLLRPVATSLPHAKRGTALALSPCGGFIATAGGDGSLAICDAANLRGGGEEAVAAREAAPAEEGSGQEEPVAPHPHPLAGEAGSGALATLCFDASGGWLASGAGDGSLFLHHTPGAAGSAAAADDAAAVAVAAAEGAAAAEPVAGEGAPGVDDTPDDGLEPLLPQRLAGAAREAEALRGAAVREETAARLRQLQARLAALLERNAAAPVDQRLSQEEVIVDVGRLQELRAEADAEAAALHARLSEAVARDEILAARIKERHWDSLEVKPKAVTGIISHREVWNFPLPRPEPGGGAFAAVAAHRREELLQQAEAAAAAVAAAAAAATGGRDSFTGQQPGRDSPGAAAAAAAVEPATQQPAASAPEPPADQQQQAQQPAAAAPTPAGGGSAGPAAAAAGGLPREVAEALYAGRPIPPAQLLYGEREVTTIERKRAQAVICRRIARELKAAFNSELDALSRRKRADADRVADANTRLDDLEREISKLALAGEAEGNGDAAAAAAAGHGQGQGQGQAGGEADGAGAGPAARVVVRWADVEDLEEWLFKVKPEEMVASKYLSPEDRARAAAAEAAEADARRRAASDDASARALDEMMGGSLVRPSDAVADLAAERPDWMNGNPQSFTEEQLREYREYQAKEKAAIEERVKRRAAMEQERRALQAAAFDDALAALAQRRLGVLSETCSLEGRAARLEADAAAAAAASEEEEAAAAALADAARQRGAHIERELSDARAVLALQQDRAAAAHSEERAADRTFRREFHEFNGDPAAAGRLAQLYRQRLSQPAAEGSAAAAAAPGQLVWPAAAQAGASPRAAAAAAAAAPPPPPLLDPPPPQVLPLPESARPEGVDEAAWERFAEIRSARAALELRARDASASAARAARTVAALEARAAAAAADADAAAARAEAIRAARRAACEDVEVRLRLRAGQVEAEPAGVSASLPGAVLVPADAIEALNGVVREKGRAKLELLGRIKDFKKGIYALQWENRRVEMEAEDVASLARELQLLHVTKDFQRLVKAGPGAKSNAAGKEVASLEALLRTRGQLHAKRVEEGRRQLQRLERDVEAKAAQNAEARARTGLGGGVESHLAGLERLLQEQARLQEAAADAREEPHERRMRSTVIARKLRDIASAQDDRIAALRAELARLEARSFPRFPEPGAAAAAGGGAEAGRAAARGAGPDGRG
ncbi:cilia- and flagella-associated protein [Raphidocelis subcapitata]|uniref:Cilia-and flagella-associated protein n=1 Tax=Raphidocelis subcapitata TaxID=307507 RepID=A0A2V0NT74_9CHLO|nr:cilia- and flagella-associated protein [Raphidocelis subcapitata]|eukprot:GBF90834.1 cilia- and flagella-associated protein [Raphidocelis subcapitata]